MRYFPPPDYNGAQQVDPAASTDEDDEHIAEVHQHVGSAGSTTRPWSLRPPRRSSEDPLTSNRENLLDILYPPLNPAQERPDAPHETSSSSRSLSDRLRGEAGRTAANRTANLADGIRRDTSGWVRASPSMSLHRSSAPHDAEFEHLFNTLWEESSSTGGGTSQSVINNLPNGTYGEWAVPGETEERCPICFGDVSLVLSSPRIIQLIY